LARAVIAIAGDAGRGAILERVSPVTGDVVSRVAASSVADARHAANVAASAFPAWSRTPPTERRALLERAAAVLLARRDDFTAAIRDEIGGTAAWAEMNCRLAASILREAAAMTTQIGGEVIPSDRDGSLSLAVRRPCGVVLSLAPWNAPLVLGVRGIAMPLACGNTVVLKASELCPRAHAMIGEVFAEAGLPVGAVSVVHNAADEAGEIVESLIAHPAVRRVTFTGSTRAGRVVAELCARYLKKVLLELGGKAALIVLDDADIDEAVKAATYGAFFNQGQLCMSTERVLVHEDVAEAFVERFAARAGTLKAGDPRLGRCPLGPMIGEQAAQRVRAMIDDAVSKGARVLVGGHLDGAFLDATVLDGLTPSMRIYYEECFGPVASIIRFSDIEEAISIANDTEYGLAAAVFGRDVTRALAVAERLETGICHINAATIQDEPQMPFGGMKSSGYGRFGGRAGIEEFTELRWISIQSGSQEYPL
jgi:acyl-CoA reductase-like NAD-dependent aldehyde dehydrogenase